MAHNPPSAFILSGGKSSRFGGDKSLYPYMDKPLIQHVYDTISPLFSSIAIIADEGDKYAFLNAPVYPDIIPGLGPLGGIYTALNNTGSRAFIFACDMPYLNIEFIMYMMAIPDQYDLIIPVISGLYEPLHAIYKTTCIPLMKEQIEAGNKKIAGFFDSIDIRTVGEDEIVHYGNPDLIFRNINYQDDIEH